MKHIKDILSYLDIDKKDAVFYGEYKAKLRLSLLDKPENKTGKYVLVSAMTPTKFGEGKTLTTIGLSMAINELGKKAVACIRQPSLGPYLGVKGGGTGGGKCRALPEDDINMHFTGDNYSVSTAHNLIASILDNHIFRGNELNLDLGHINWGRVSDVSDGALRSILLGMNWKDKSKDFPRKSGYAITAASELMSILALSKNWDDFKEKIDSVIVAFNKKGSPVSLKDLSCSGAVAMLLKDAVMPNIVQTSSGTPCFIHTGPFANISIGSSSIIADKIALSVSDYVITESGFGMDCGGEKFFHIKSRASNITPDAIVLVISIRALKEYGDENLKTHIENANKFNRPVIVCINKREEDADSDLDIAIKKAMDFGAYRAVVSALWKDGAQGGAAFAQAVMQACNLPQKPISYLYDLDTPIIEKAKKLAIEVYRAKDLELSDEAMEKIRLFEDAGFGNLPICVAKTQFSISHSKELGPAPRDYIFKINDAFLSAGAGFIVLICGNISVLPSLPSHPRALNIQAP